MKKLILAILILGISSVVAAEDEVITYNKIDGNTVERIVSQTTTQILKEKDLLTTKANLLNDLDRIESEYLSRKTEVEDKLAVINEILTQFVAPAEIVQ